ncbi:MAG: 50S ribosomal protein L9 [Candidatus Pelagibacter sp.]|nr:50S ribosomal protein L9 [Candidatus Pelagibacter sp.]|tara:strand:+ start:44 stop:502 length:459 start_codon:yes stop_codon:yes gene_type:complete
MKIILLENIRKIGSIGEVIEVKRGFARNFLIANKKALYASKENIKEVEKIKSELNKKDQEKKKAAKEIFDKIKSKEYIIKKLSTENKELYGSVKPTEISKIIKDTDKIEIKPSMIQLMDDIKSLGEFRVNINLHSDVQAEIKISVLPAEVIQ